MDKLGIFKDNHDGTIKCVFSDDGKIIEMSLLMNRGDTDVVCVPTHHFCNLGCKMCHLTNNSLNKAMVPIQPESFIEALKNTVCNQKTGERRTSKKILLLSFMGVGEPLLNLNLITEIYKSQDILKAALGYDAIGYALATMMPSHDKFKSLEAIVDELAIPLKVHFSLHTPVDNERHELIPSTRVNVEEACSLLYEYSQKMNNNPKFMENYRLFHKTGDVVEIHYTLISGVNDGDDELNLLINLLKKYKFTIKFIRFNPKDTLCISTKEQVWVDELTSKTSSRVKTYSPPGKEVGSSCGEFTKHYYHEEIENEIQKNEFLEWKKSHEIFD